MTKVMTIEDAAAARRRRRCRRAPEHGHAGGADGDGARADPPGEAQSRPRLPRRRHARRLARGRRRDRPLHRGSRLDGAVRPLPAVPQGGRGRAHPRRGAVRDGAERPTRRRRPQPPLPPDPRPDRHRPDRHEREPDAASRIRSAARRSSPAARSSPTSRSSTRTAPTSTGNVQYEPTILWPDIGIFPKAARKVIVTVEEIVDSEVLRRNPDRTVLPGFRVDAVVEVPYGAHPTSFFPRYGYDTQLPPGVGRGWRATPSRPRTFLRALRPRAGDAGGLSRGGGRRGPI